MYVCGMCIMQPGINCGALIVWDGVDEVHSVAIKSINTFHCSGHPMNVSSPVKGVRWQMGGGEHAAPQAMEGEDR